MIGATGFEPDELERIAEAARTIPILRSGNFSIGVNMLVGLVAQAARALPAHAWDIEILEAHHNRKIDAPSGTALMLGEAAAEGRGVSLASVERRGRDGITGERPTGEIGFAVLRRRRDRRRTQRPVCRRRGSRDALPFGSRSRHVRPRRTCRRPLGRRARTRRIHNGRCSRAGLRTWPISYQGLPRRRRLRFRPARRSKTESYRQAIPDRPLSRQ